MGDPDKEDELIWLKNKDRGFSIKSMYETMSIQKPESSPRIYAWNPLIQLKVSYFVWKLWWDCPPTMDNLIKRGMMDPNWCCLCMLAGESSRHLFLHYPWVSYFWNYVCTRLGMEWIHPGSIH